MNKSDIAPFLNKRIKICLPNGFSYTGRVEELNETSFVLFDKFGKDLKIAYSAVALIEAMP